MSNIQEFSSGSTMNFRLGREDEERNSSIRSCFYCGTIFDNYRALVGHLRIHWQDSTLRSFNFPGSRNSIDINRNPLASLPNSQQSSAGASNPTLITRAPPLFDFFPNDANEASWSISTGSNPGVSQNSILMNPSGVTSHHNGSTLRAFAAGASNANMSSNAFAVSGNVVPTGLSAVSSYLGSNGVYQFNTDEFHMSHNGLPPTFADALKVNQGYNFWPPPFSGAGEVCQSERSLLMGGRKRPYMANNQWVLPLKELPLFNNFVESVSASETCDGAEEEGPADLDLSLKLMIEPKRTRITPVAPVEQETRQMMELPLLDNFVESMSALETRDGAEEEGSADLDLSLHL